MKISVAFSGIGLAGVETSPFIYYTENHANYADKMQEIFQRVLSGQLEVITSTITLTECLSTLIAAYNKMLRSTRRVRLVPVNVMIAARAADLRAHYNLRTPDAIHVASALVTGCDVFLTNDLALKRVQEIPVFVLNDLELD